MITVKRYQIFYIFLMMFVLAGIIISKINVKAEEIVSKRSIESMDVVFIEIGDNPDFSQLKEMVLFDDVRYIAHPEALSRDLDLSEVVISNIDYTTYSIQDVGVEVIRYNPSKLGKVEIDRVNKELKIQFIDTSAPEITLKKNSVSVIEGESINVEDYLLDVSDNSYLDVDLQIVEDIDFDTPGTYLASFIAKDSFDNESIETLSVIVKEKPKPKPPQFALGSVYSPSRVTRYGFDCAGCRVSSGGYSKTAGGILISGDKVRQANGEWQTGLTYGGYHIVATSRSIPMFSILKISDHPFSGQGITAGQPFYAIVGDRGVGGTSLDLFVGTQSNINAITQRGNPSRSNTKVEIVRFGR